jgi:hypothetical protein
VIGLSVLSVKQELDRAMRINENPKALSFLLICSNSMMKIEGRRYEMLSFRTIESRK